jgi:F-type H+-transporting ATPase subunit a
MEGTNVLFSIGPLQVTSTVTTMWGVIIVLGLLSYFATRNLKTIPGPLQNVAELAVESLQKYFTGNLGKTIARRYLPIFATFFVFIIVSNYTGILPGFGHVSGMATPTACLSVTAALGIIAFFTTHAVGIRERGFGAYIKTFIMPIAVMLPLNLLEQVIRPVSLALRLYGNMYGEEMVTEQLYEILPIGAPLIMNALSLIFCFIQAMVFTMLLSIYVSEAVGEE